MVLLLKNIGYEIPIWSGIARYWPVLLIVWGVVKLVDYARWKKAGQPGPLFGAGEVILLIIVILSGTALTAAANMSPDFGAFFNLANIDLFDLTGNSYPFSQHLEKEVPAGATIEIINRYGNVEVTPRGYESNHGGGCEDHHRRKRGGSRAAGEGLYVRYCRGEWQIPRYLQFQPRSE
jgi:hypothetical protein